MEIRGLNSVYGETQVLFDIYFSIPRHRITVIMGPSGCGKSTLVRHLIGLKPPLPQQVFLEGKDLARFSAEEMNTYRRRMGVLFQSGALFNSLTVTENIAVPLRVHTRLPDETIRIIAQIKLHQVGLTDFGSYMPSQLSGGMQKRAGLARSLAMDPELLFVDEPSSGLDPITAAGLDELILELREALGMTIIVVTHELESAFRIADQMIVLDQGRLLAAGPPEEIQHSQDGRVIQFLERRAEQKQVDTEAYMKSLLRTKSSGDSGKKS
jgi:phospholipid/cholesterol/gamma-HCH transport system ATP-binding protein